MSDRWIPEPLFYTQNCDPIPQDYNSTPNQSIRQSSVWKTVQSFINAYPSDIAFQVIIAFAVGLLFAPWSWGLAYLIIFFVIFEIGYAIIHRDFSWNNIMVRISVIGASFLGWLIGRLAVEDRFPLRPKYKDEYCKAGCRGFKKDWEEVPEFAQFDKDELDRLIKEMLN
jgi:hypothetical protein